MNLAPAESLKRRLAESGPMSVGAYMAWCLTGRTDAYYRQGNPLGASGDFVTAPEISQIFGELIAMWACVVWKSMAAPSPFLLVELGPGRGILMQDVLRAARSVPAFADAAQVHLVESSSTLRAVQKDALTQLAAPQWHDDITTMPDGPAILIANEFFDALAVEQNIFTGGEWRRRVISLGSTGEPEFGAGGPALPPAGLVPSSAPQEGDILESRPAIAALMAEFGRRAQSAPFAMLLADYGYERPDYGDTFQAVRHHGYANPLEAPGEADLSAHVNFPELRLAADAVGLEAWGPMRQGEFLVSLGLEQRLRQLLSAAREDQRADFFLGARRLVDPYQMGNLFKVMAVTSPGLPAPPPFAQSVLVEDGG